MKEARVPEYCRIECRVSKRVLEWTPSSPPIMDLLEQAGGRPAYSCRYGNCHTCTVDILAGEVAHPPEVTLPGAGKLLPCCAVPLSAELVLDI